MSQFSGPYPGYKDSRTRTKGVMQKRRAQKRLEAEARDDLLAPDDPKRRSVRLGSMPEPDLSTRRRRNRRRNATRVQQLPDFVESEAQAQALS